MSFTFLMVGFAATTAAVLAISQVLSPVGAQVASRIERLEGGASLPLIPAGGRVAARRGLLRALAAKADPLVHVLDSGHLLDRALWQAQIAWTPAEFALAALGLSLAAAALGWMLLPHPLGLLAMLAGTAPFFMLKRRVAFTRKQLTGQLPDALLLIVNALRAGHGLMQAIRIVAGQVVAPMGTEFGVVLSEINLGLSVDQAFLNLAGRADLVDVDLAVGAILVQRETGGNLSEILTHIQDTLRDRARIAGEVHALTAQGRLSGWVLGLLPVGVGLLFSLVNPAYLQPFFVDPRGRALMIGAATLQVLGILAIRKIVDVKY